MAPGSRGQGGLRVGAGRPLRLFGGRPPRKAGARYVVLAEIRGDEAVILDPGVGPFTLPVPDLVESVGDVGTMWVSNP